MFRSHLISFKKVYINLALQDLYKIESTFFIIQSYQIASLFEMSGNNSSASGGNNSSSAADAPLTTEDMTTEELMAELKLLRAEIAVRRERDAAAAAAAAAEQAAAEQATAAATSKEAVSKTPAPKASLSQALVPFTPPTGGGGRPSSPPRTTSHSNWNRYRATQRLAARMSQASVIALYAILESGGSLEAAAEAGRVAAKRAATPTRGPYVLVDLPPPPPRKSKSSKQ